MITEINFKYKEEMAAVAANTVTAQYLVIRPVFAGIIISRR